MSLRRSIVFLFAWSGASALAQEPDRPNLILVTVDTLRADRVGAYGHESAATPALDMLAARGVVFDNAFAHSPVTLSSHASLLTGRLPTRHGVRSNSFYRLPESETTLAEILADNGYDTAAFIAAAPLDRRFGLSQGFAVYDDDVDALDGKRLVRERDGAVIVESAFQWLAGRADAPFFLWAHLFEPHHPYEPPERYRERFASDPYDGEVAYADQLVGAIYDANPARSNTLFVVTSDHGESLGEHGEQTHGVFVYDATIRVPLIVAGPGLEPDRRSEIVGLVDVLPTILRLVGIDPPEGVALDGGDMLGERTERSVYAESYLPRDYYGWSPLTAVRTERFKYIDAPTPELYRLDVDPGETLNVISQNAGTARDLAGQLTAFVGGEGLDAGFVPDDELLAELQSLGYVGAAAAGETSTRTVDPKDKIGIVVELDVAVSAVVEKRYDDALARLVTILDDDPTNILATHYIAEVFFELGRDEESIRAYRAVMDRGHDATRYHAQLAELFERTKRYPEAAAETRVLVERGRVAAADVLTKARSLLDDGEADGALAYLTMLSDIGSGGAGLALLTAEAQVSAGASEAALQTIETVLEEAPDHDGLVRARVRLLKLLGASYGQNGELERARAMFTAVLAVEPDDFDALANLAFTHLQSGDRVEALPLLERALESRPDELRILNLTAEILFRDGRLDESRELLTRSLAIDPNQPRIRDALAEVDEALAR